MEDYWTIVWKSLKRHPAGVPALIVIVFFILVGIYAPFLASSKPLFVIYNGEWYFPLFRYLFYPGFFTKRIDIFFNLMMFTFPLALLFRRKKILLLAVVVAQFTLFFHFILSTPKDPAANAKLNQEKQTAVQKRLKEGVPFDWNFELHYMTPYAKLNALVKYRIRKEQNTILQQYSPKGKEFPTLWVLSQQHLHKLESILEKKDTPTAKAKLAYLQDKNHWLQTESKKLDWMVMPLIRPYHWEDDAGGSESMNEHLPWWELTRTNRKDLVAALIFGVRISLVVGILAVSLALAIGVPIGAFAGFYGGWFDIFVSRMLEIWQSMPTFFMLLFLVAITQSKSIFLVVAVIGVFGWTTFSRYIRGEFFKQRNLPYVEACRSLGFRDRYIIFTHILPNAVPPLLTLLPFAIMGAITSEAGLAFLGLGEENSCSWGVLMNEGRTAFPGESYLLWPPAILLTTLLVAIAIAGDAVRDALDPHLSRDIR